MRPAIPLLFCCFLLAPVSAEAQFLSRDTRALWTNEVFENYGTHGYRDYDFEEENRRFDFFGDLLIDGGDILEYSEVRRDAPGQIGSYEARSDGYNDFFQKLVIANEGFGSWSTRLIFGEHLRTVFRTFDADGSGDIDMDEVRAARLHCPPPNCQAGQEQSR